MNNTRTYAPVALFVYNRPEHTRITIDSLAKNPEAIHTRLFIFSDAPKSKSEELAVYKVRNYIRQIDGFAQISITESEENLGLANSIIQGVTDICKEYMSVIVLEDDLETSPYFLAYMNDALERFRKDERVSAISGYMFPIQHDFGNRVFYRATPLSWGWATWGERWETFNADGQELLNELKRKKKLWQFNYVGPQPFTTMLRNQISGKNNSWFVRWCAGLFLSEKLTIMPTKSLVKNIGIDGTGTHCASWRFNPYEVELTSNPVEFTPLEFEQSQIIERKLKKYFIKIRLLRYINFIYRVFKR